MSRCRGCGRPGTAGALGCPECGQRHPSGSFPSVAAGILFLFALAVVGAFVHAFLPGEQEEALSAPTSFQVVERWGVGLYGVGLSVVVPRESLDERGMEALRRELRSRHPDRGFLRAYLFSTPQAAALRRPGVEGELGNEQEAFDRAFLGLYERNDRLGVEQLSWAPGGLRRTDRPRILDWQTPDEPLGSNPEAEPGVIWAEAVEVARGEAYQGPWRMNRSDFRYVDAPSVDLTGDGRLAVVWVDQARKDVFFQLRSPAQNEPPPDPVNVSRSPDVFSWLPRVALDRDDPNLVHVLWQEIVFSGGSHGGEIYYARSTDGGRTFSEPLNLSETPAGAGKGRLTAQEWHNGSLDLALGSNGHLYVAWTEYEGALRFRRSLDRGGSFREAVRVGGYERRAPARGPSLAVAAGGTIHLAWTVGEDRRADIHLARSDDGGQSFSAPERPVRTPGHSDAPKVTADGAGVLHLAFGDRPGGPARASRVLYTRSADGGDAFEEPREVSDPERGGAGFPHLAAGPDGHVHLLWENLPRPDRWPQGLFLRSSLDGGETFSDPHLVPGTAGPELGFSGSLQGLLMRKLAADGSGRIAVVNGTFNPDEESRIRLIAGRVAEP